ncbi:MAG TPA: YggS family pyridoxal phosphate-dependent enzyme [Chloroflexota bacterium]|jgi:pyridoxal phosphate enzyme (YggS family)|nr:YggS family pyridoxal phosphate-dependent enzyme [Chloroflexota bacterium]
MSDLADNLASVRAAIAEAALAAGREPDDITLVGAAKTVAAERVAEALQLGLTDIGENFVQEAESKIPQVLALAGSRATWHMIGHLQTNKVKTALSCFDVVETVDSLRLASALSRRAGDASIDVLLEVSLADEAERTGFRPTDLEQEYSEILRLSNLRVRGLMTVAPLGLEEAETRAVFRQVRELRDRLRDAHPEHELATLSMGMTDDFPLAILEGATAVRVGRAIFGARPS